MLEWKFLTSQRVRVKRSVEIPRSHEVEIDGVDPMVIIEEWLEPAEK
jgi:hypothetical protein